MHSASSPVRFTIFMFTSSSKKLIFILEKDNVLVVTISQTCTVVVNTLLGDCDHVTLNSYSH